MGDFSEDCLSTASSAAAQIFAVLQEAAGEGSLFFGYFLLAKQKKVTRKSRESDNLQFSPALYSYHSSSASAAHSNH